MPQYERFKFGDLLIEPVRNGVYKKAEFHGSGAKVVNMGELFAHPRLRDIPMKRVNLTATELAKNSILEGDLLFARRSLTAAGAGKCCLIIEVKEPTTFESSLMRARVNPEKADSKYLFYYFNSPAGKQSISSILRQVAVSGITGSDLSSLQIELPPIKVQNRIASILDKFDERIECNRKQVATLERIAGALFKSWFIHFDPVREKAAGRQAQLQPHIQEQFPSLFCESTMGKIPAGWHVYALDEIGEFLNGLALQKYPPKGSSTIPVIKIAQLRANSVQGADIASAEVPSEYHVHDGDLLFSWSGSLECKVWTGGSGALNQHLFKVTSRNYPQWLLYFSIHEHLNSFREIAAGKATTMGHIQRKHLTEANLALPSKDVLAILSHPLENMYHRMTSLRLQMKQLELLRDALLPKLLGNELEVGSRSEQSLA